VCANLVLLPGILRCLHGDFVLEPSENLNSKLFSKRFLSLNCHLNMVEGFEYPNDPRSYVVQGYMTLVGSPKANRS